MSIVEKQYTYAAAWNFKLGFSKYVEETFAQKTDAFVH